MAAVYNAHVSPCLFRVRTLRRLVSAAYQMVTYMALLWLRGFHRVRNLIKRSYNFIHLL